MSASGGVIALRDYVDIAELRIRSTRLARACGLDSSHQGLVALAVTDAGMFALQHADGPEAELLVATEDTSPHLVVTVRETRATVADTDSVFAATGHDRGLMLAERASEHFSVRADPSNGMTVTMSWALSPDIGWPDADDSFTLGASEDGRPSVIDVLRRETGEVAVLLEVLRRTDAAIEEKAELFAQVTAELQVTNRIIGLDAAVEHASEPDALLAALVRSSPDALFSMTPDLVINSWNPASERLFGYKSGAIIGQHVGVLMPDEVSAEMEETVRRLAAGAPATPYDTVRRRKDGSSVEVTATISVVRDHAGRWIGYSAALRDLTDHRRAQRHLVAALTDRERLAAENRAARDLHDFAVRRLVACGVALQNAIGLDAPRELTAWVEHVVDELDVTINEIRSKDSDSHQRPLSSIGVRAQLLELASQTASVLGFEPRVCFVGEVDEGIPADVAEHMVAVAREALSNVVSHAHAAHVGVMVQVGREAVIEVADDGRGLGKAGHRSGLRGLAARADSMGGAFTLTSFDGAGTRLEWRAPLPVTTGGARPVEAPVRSQGGLLSSIPQWTPDLHLDVLRETTATATATATVTATAEVTATAAVAAASTSTL